VAEEAVLALVIALSWVVFYLAFNPPSHQFVDILFLEGFVAGLLACTMTTIKLAEVGNGLGAILATMVCYLALRHAFTSPARSTKRRIEQQRRSSDLEATQ
jgi:ABC-type phosphate/phosphonate transport system permease subunit